jgi:hypothetical protein
MITETEELHVYRGLLNSLYVCRRISLDSKKIDTLLNAIDSWQRSADFQAQSDEDYDDYRDKAFQRFREVVFNT